VCEDDTPEGRHRNNEGLPPRVVTVEGDLARYGEAGLEWVEGGE
jgi:hypothetical protein